MHYGFHDSSSAANFADDIGGLFNLPSITKLAKAVPVTPGRLGPNAAIPRQYQVEDINSAKAAWASGKRAVLYRAATGLGKATVLATIATTYRAEERTLVLIDTVKLAKQLRQTFARQLGFTPGLIGGGIFDGADRRVIICVQQSLNSDRGEEKRFEQLIDPTQFGLVLIDECEAALADGYAGVVRYMMNGNPELHVMGCTATPIRGDGVGMGAMFDHVVEEEGALNRGPLWAFQNGWLVPPVQKFVQCSVDFSSLKVKKNGQDDYSDDKIAELLSSDEHLIELAQAIVRTAGDDRSMVVCPNSTDICDKIADYLNGAKAKSAWSVHGKIDDADAVMASHQRGEFQFLCGVNMLTKGYDDPKIKKVYILRPTKSQRLFQQVIGRAFRPHDSIARQLGELTDPAERRALIANSPKPKALIYCLVGVDASARDMQIADLLRGRLSDEELDRVKERMLDGAKDEDGKIAVGGDTESLDVAEAVKEVKKIIRDEREAANRRRIEIEKAELQITDLKDGQHMSGGVRQWAGPYEVCRRMGFKDHELEKLTPDQAGKEAQRWVARSKVRPRLCSRGQWRLLASRGNPASILETLSFKDASDAINRISIEERWKPKAGV